MHSLPLVPDLAIPVRNIFCIGRNYAEHARELGNAVPEKPVVFLKPISAIAYAGQFIEIPSMSQRVDHEGEIVVALGNGGKDVSEQSALQLVAGYGVGIDVTARDLQDEAKKKSLPWSIAKGFDTFAVLGSFVPASEVPDPQALSLSLWVNGQLRQSGRSSDMLFPVAKIISFLSSVFTLAPGDLIYTGTPPGVAPLQEGDEVRVEMNSGLASLRVKVRKA